MLGQATVGDGPVMAASQLATLEVSQPYFTFTFPAVAVEQGKATELAIGVEKRKDFAGTAQVELVGLPNGVTTQPCQINKDAKEALFSLKATANSPVGQHKNSGLSGGDCRGRRVGKPRAGYWRVAQSLNPPPPKLAKTAQPATPPPTAEKTAKKHLSRLEQLRLEHQKSGTGQ